MPKVTIYTTPTCIFCKQTKEFFRENNIIYEEKDVSQDAAAAQEMVAKSHQMGVPVSLITPDAAGEPRIIIGFDKQALTDALGLS
jgi:glutaredoxin-like YruB-family protein